MDKQSNDGYDQDMEYCAELLDRAGWKLRDAGTYPADEVDHSPQDTVEHKD